MRIGCGIDLHRLILDPGRPLMLGGVEIPSELALEGHSDADCILHALTDALLGALALGDIGEYFPNTDPAWKDAPSTVFLERALSEMRLRHYSIANVDIAVLAEAPKLSPHKAAIRGRLAELLGVQENQVGLKATTLEKLGALGRGEGVLAQAVVLLAPMPSTPAKRTRTAKAAVPAPVEAEVPVATKQAVVARDLASRPSPRAAAADATPPRTSSGEGPRVLQVWTDGASRGNPGPAAIGVVLKDAEGRVLHRG
ncbi:MAG TPA: 2-C-methyl-D-erythritol 2,4-cyclodiphosphate synthase, partial [bacterium]|nr:2-C-methyl-D-erythritol 2,4-cyclodiphosphate synthase [bacterium]